MGFMDEAKNMAAEQGLEQAGEMINEQTGGEYEEQVEQAKGFVQEQLGGGEEEGQ